jgi:hypothetical protein
MFIVYVNDLTFILDVSIRGDLRHPQTDSPVSVSTRDQTRARRARLEILARKIFENHRSGANVIKLFSGRKLRLFILS